MRSFIWKGLIGVAFTGGLLALGAGVSYADDNTSGDDGTGSGSQAIIGLNLPITIGGNGISVLGDSTSSGTSTTPPSAPAASSGSTSGNVSLLGGTQALLDVHAPVTVGGNAISVIGASGSSSSTVGSGSGSAGGASGTGTGSTGSTSGDHSTLGGTQVLGDVSAPVTVGGNAISVVGDSTSDGSFAGQSAGGSGTTAPGDSSGATSPGAFTTGDNGIGGGTQVVPDVAAPVLVSGNAVSVLGDSSSTGSSASNGGSAGSGATGGTPAPITSGSDSVLGGTQVVPDVTAPVTATGDAISVVGDSTSGGSSSGAGTGTVGGTDTIAPITSGDGSILGGSQIAPTVTAPITIGGDAVSVIGNSSTTPTDPGQPGQVGGVDTFPPTTTSDPGTISAAALSVQALASTGVNALPALLAGLLLLLAGLGALGRGAFMRKAATS